MDGKIGPRCGMLLSELAPDVESALDVENGPRLGTNPRSESNIYIYIYMITIASPLRLLKLLLFIIRCIFKTLFSVPENLYCHVDVM